MSQEQQQELKPAMFQCPQCGTTYKHKQSLDTHVKSKHHPDAVKFQCHLCQSSFHRKWMLKRHLQAVHKSPTTSNKEKSINHQSAGNSAADQELQPPAKKKRKLQYREETEDLPQTESPVHPSHQQLMQYGYPENALPQISSLWEYIRTKYRDTKLKNLYQFRLADADQTGDLLFELRKYLQMVHKQQKSAYKLQFGFTVLLHKPSTDEYRVFWAMNATRQLYPTPVFITSKDEFVEQLEKLDGSDLLKHMCQDKPETSWVLVAPLAVSVVVYKLTQPFLLMGSTQLKPFLLMGSPHSCNSPPHIKHHPHIRMLDVSPDTQQPYGDQLCIWRSIAYNIRNKKTVFVQTLAKQLSDKFMQYMGYSAEEYNGSVSLDAMFQVELFIKARIFIYVLDPKDNCSDLSGPTAWKHFVAQLVYPPVSSALKRKKDTKYADMYFVLSDCHVSPITNIQKFGRTFVCRNCKMAFKQRNSLHKHQKTCFNKKSHRGVYKVGNYSELPSLWTKLEQNGIRLDTNLKFTPWFACWDCECLLVKLDPNDPRQPSGDKLKFNTVCEFLAVAVNSNLSPYNEPKFFCREHNISASELFTQFMDYLLEISEQYESKQKRRYQHVFDQISIKQNENQQKLEATTNSDVAAFFHQQVKFFAKLNNQLENHCSKLVLFTFNGARFDNKLVRDLLLQELFTRGETNPQCIKRQGSYTLLMTKRLIFRDFAQMLPPGSSLDSFYKSQNLPVAKAHLPYDWFDSIDKLYHTSLPPREAFYNSLTNKELPLEKYNKVQSIFNQSCRTMKDYLKFYNEMDVKGFVMGISGLCQLYKGLGLCLIQDGVSLSALAYKFLHRSSVPKNPVFFLPGETEKFVFDLVEKCIVGGPSIVFCRYSSKDETYIRNSNTICKSILGEDCNCLYLYCIGKEQPTGIPVHWKYNKKQKLFIRNKLLPHYVSHGEMQFVLWKQHEMDCNCCSHFLNGGGQAMLGHGRKFRPDFLCTTNKLIWLYNGCYIHKHSCHLNKKPDTECAQNKRKHDQEAMAYYKSLGFQVNIKTECEWHVERRQPHIQKFLHERIEMPFHSLRSMTEQQLLAKIQSNQLFGILRADVAVKDVDYDTFAPFPPIFTHKNIDRSYLCPEMLERAEELHLLKRPAKCLVSVMKTKQFTMITPIAKWYLDHNIQITNITEFVQFKPQSVFKEFTNTVTKNRIAADADKSLELIGALYKNIGNGAYGKTMERKDRFTQTRFCELQTASALINRPHFMDVDSIGDTEQIWELTMQKRRYKENNCKQLAAFILGYAKLRLLEYYYDFLCKYFPLNTWELLEIDTDSFYLAISASTRDEFFALVKPEMKAEFEREKHNFVATKTNARQPGVFKNEWHGDAMICLCPKSYVCIKNDTADKFSAKGVSRRTNNLLVEQYKACLLGKETPLVTNKGFLFKSPFLYKYELEKRGLVDFYYKRQLCSDNLFKTKPLPDLDV